MSKSSPFKTVFCGDRAVWIVFMLLACYSIVAVFSATSTIAFKNQDVWGAIVRHVSFLLGGTALISILSRTHYRYFSLAIFLLPISILMLIATPFFGVSTNSAYRWLPIFGIQFQPSEFGKLACVVYIAFWLSKRRKLSSERVYKFILYGTMPVAFLTGLFNLSTALLILVVSFLLMFIGQIPFKKLFHYAMIPIIAGVVLALAMYALPEETVQTYVPRATTWKNRIERHIEAKSDAGENVRTGAPDQITYAKVAIARGGIIGQGPGRSTQRDFLPYAYSDFIFAIIIEELGVIMGGMGVLLLYIILMIRVGIIARKCEKLLPKYLVLGCGLLIVTQALFHMAVNVDMMFVTGQPLPLISRGGTSTVLTCIYIGIILSVSQHGAMMGATDEEDEEEEDEPDELEAENGADSEINPIFAVESTASEK